MANAEIKKGTVGTDTEYLVKNVTDAIVETATGGKDTVFIEALTVGSAKAYTLSKNVEELNLSALDFSSAISTQKAKDAFLASNFVFNGNELDNTITMGDNYSEYIKIAAGAGADTVIGGAGNDNIDGGLGIDSISGGAGNDTLFGGADVVSDTLVGGDGNDTYLLSDTKDTISDTAGSNTIKLNSTFKETKIDLTNTELSYANASISNIDASAIKTALTLKLNQDKAGTVTGGAGSDTIYGSAGSDSLIGGAGDDVIYGGFLLDKISGGIGNDTIVLDAGVESYIVNLAAEYVTGGVGIDTLKIVGTDSLLHPNLVSLGAESDIENIDCSAVILDADDSYELYGSNAANTITGSTGSDFIQGGGGVDKLIGGAGSDLYSIDTYLDAVVEAKDGGTGDNIVVYNFDMGKTTAYTLTANVEGLGISEMALDLDKDGKYNEDDAAENSAKTALLTKKLTFSGNELNNEIFLSNTYADYMKVYGGAGDDKIYGGTGNDNVDGGIGVDTLYGNVGNDTLFGGSDTAADLLQGEDGDDTYILVDTKDIITDKNGTNTIKLDGKFKETTIDLTNTELTYANAKISNIDASAIKTGLTLKLNQDNAGTVTGGAGNDTITGSSGADTLIGGVGDDVIYGTYLEDKISGGVGNDTIVVDAGGDLFMDHLLDSNISGGAGIDTLKVVNAGNSYHLSVLELDNTSDVENIDCSGITDSSQRFDLWGNNLVNTLTGSSGENLLSGGGGADKLVGGAGNDVYITESYLDTIVEAEGGGDADRNVLYHYDMGKSTAYSLTANVENLDLTNLSLDLDKDGTYGEDDVAENKAKEALLAKKLAFSGNALNNNIVIGDTYGSYMKVSGGAGNDVITGGSGNDEIDGGVGNDSISGGDGNDILFGGSDTVADSLDGAAGDDTYILVDTKDTISDKVGNNTIKLNSAFSAASIDLESAESPYVSAYISNIDASATTKGVTLKLNHSNEGTVTGGAGNDTITGSDGVDTLIGGAGNDVITGTYLEDKISGGVGDDTIIIGASDFPSMTQVVNENISGGTGVDTLKIVGTYSGINYHALSLSEASDIENVDISGITDATQYFSIVGNNSANTLIGNSAENRLNGGLGADKLIGGAGNDSYVVDTYLDSVVETVDGGAFDEVDINRFDMGKTTAYSLAANVEVFDFSNMSLDLDKDKLFNEDDAAENAAKLALAKKKLTFNGNTSDNNIYISSVYGSYINTYGGAGNDKIYGGAGNDNIDGGIGNDFIQGDKGNDTLNGGLGNDTYYFESGNGKDSILTSEATDIIKIDNSLVSSDKDMLFYTDKAGTLYIDYTCGGVGADVIQIAKGKYDSSTNVVLGNESISIGSIIQHMGSYAGLDAANLNITYEDKATEAATLTWTPQV